MGRSRRVIVRFRAGPTWEGGAPEEQPDWDAHEAFIDEQVERGTIVMGGPLSDHTGSMLLMEGVSVEEARRIVELDPFMHNGVFVLDGISKWTVYVDSLSRPQDK